MTSCADLRALFCAAAGARRGYGHLVRSLSFARALGVRPLIAVRGTQQARDVALGLGADVVAAHATRAIRALRPDVVVVDDPSTPHSQRRIDAARRVGALVVTIHDLGLGCAEGDVVIDGSAASPVSARPGRVSLVGTKFAILDAQYSVAPSHRRTLAPQSAGSGFDSSKAWDHLRQQVGFGPRPAGSAALTQCRQYILAQLKAAGIAAREDAFEATTPLGRVRMVNIIATIPGRRTDRIALATHYDTKLFREFRFVGASDGASSTAAVLELGRVLKGQPHEYTIELLFLDGEEAVIEWRDGDNTYGSRHYVEAARKAGTLGGLKALVLLDMIGDRNLNIRRDTNSARWLTDIIWASAGKLGYRANFPLEDTTIDDDHVPFVRAGVPSVDIIDLDYAAWHTAQDDLDHVSARSLQVVGDVVLDALPEIQKRLASTPAR